MANKKTILEINDELDELTKINELRDLRKWIRRGQVKQPPPKGVKVKISTISPAELPNPFLDDPLPSFGGTPAIE